jgi:hypothetical protein
MKTVNKPVFCLFSALLFLGLVGCKTHTQTQNLTNGYEEITHPNVSPNDSIMARISLNHRGPDGESALVWPSLFGTDVIIKDDLAVFVGDEAYVSSNPDDLRGTKPRLFAVVAPNPPLDITDEVVWYWCKASGKDFARALQLFNMATLVNRGDKVEVQLDFYVNESGWPDNGSLQLDWNQISEIMRTVKAKGKVQRDPRWGTPYIQN